MNSGQTLVHSLDEKVLAEVNKRIDSLLCDPAGLPSGKNKRKKLTSSQAQKFKSALIHAVEYAAVWASHRLLPNRLRGRGRPPDNAVFIFIDDIARACEEVGLKPGRRYVAWSESLPVQLYIELAPLLWGPVKAPRRLFERWQRHRSNLVRA
jgi:hypothetical protein